MREDPFTGSPADAGSHGSSVTNDPLARVPGQLTPSRPGHQPPARLDLRALLDAVTVAPPAEAVDALARGLTARIGAREVSTLLADTSGPAMVRLARRTGRARSAPRRAVGEHVRIGCDDATVLIADWYGEVGLPRGSMRRRRKDTS